MDTKTIIEQIWPKVWPLIQSAVVLENESDIVEDLITERRFLLVIGEGIAIIRPCQDFLEINYVGGKNAKKWWGAMSANIEIIARTLGCRKIVAYGRDAWQRLAPDFTPTDTRMYVKEISHG